MWSNSTDEARQRATARLEDRAVPLEERLADLHVWMAEDARKEEREREEWAARKPSEEIKRRVERALRSEDNDRRKHAALRDKVQKTIQKHRK